MDDCCFIFCLFFVLRRRIIVCFRRNSFAHFWWRAALTISRVLYQLCLCFFLELLGMFLHKFQTDPKKSLKTPSTCHQNCSAVKAPQKPPRGLQKPATGLPSVSDPIREPETLERAEGEASLSLQVFKNGVLAPQRAPTFSGSVQQRSEGTLRRVGKCHFVYSRTFSTCLCVMTDQ